MTEHRSSKSDVRNLHRLVVLRSHPDIAGRYADLQRYVRTDSGRHEFGRTARLLMNLLLLRGGYPPIPVRPEDRLAYIRALQQAQAGEGTAAFDTLLYERLDATLADYLNACRNA